MLLGLFAAIAAASVYWLVVPARWRREVVAAASIGVLGLHDWRLIPLLGGTSLGLWWLARKITSARGLVKLVLTCAGLILLGALFLANKTAGAHYAVLASQGGLMFLGVSYLVLKAAAVLIETARGGLGNFHLREVFAWLVFLPTYPSGPMEDFEHFRRQDPVFRQASFLGGLERILFGLLKVLLLSHYLGEWLSPILAAPADFPRHVLLLGVYAFTLRFYFDFSGYSDIAIGLGALCGYDIEENFDRPLTRRNLAELWRHWHMTLTRFLRLYLFIPVTRRILRAAPRLGSAVAIGAGQMAAMIFCGLWHGLGWNFLVWGALQGIGLTWLAAASRPVGALLPPTVVGWWRSSRIAHLLSVLLTFHFFALSTVFVITDLESALAYLRLLFLAR